jgi:hypothetical protein
MRIAARWAEYIVQEAPRQYSCNRVSESNESAPDLLTTPCLRRRRVNVAMNSKPWDREMRWKVEIPHATMSHILIGG